MQPRRPPLAALTAAVGIGAAMATCSAAADLPPGVRSLSLAGLGIELTLVCMAVAGASLSSRPLRESLGLHRSGMSGGRVLLLVIGTVALSHALDGMLDWSGLRERSALAAFDETLAGTRGADLALALVAMALGPALGEELLCRGWIQRGLTPRLGSARAVALASLIFGLLHLDPIHALFAVALGVYLGVVALWAGSTRTSMLCHGVNNALAIAVAAGVLAAPPHGALGTLVGFGLAGTALWAARPLPVAPGAAPISGQDRPSALQPGPRTDDS